MTEIATYEHFIEPVLRILAEHPSGLETSQAYQAVADRLALTKAQRALLLPSGRQATYKNRIGWAYDRLKRAGLAANLKRGIWSITTKGQDLLDASPQGLSQEAIVALALVERDSTLNTTATTPSAPPLRVSQTPSEAIESALEALNQSVAQELMEHILAITPEQFEGLVLELLLAMGYGADQRALTRTGGSADGGIDGMITLDRLGLEKVYIQAKRWALNNSVGRPELQSFYGALAIRKANKGVFITTSSFTTPAIEYAAQVSNGIVLVDGELLTQLMIEYGVGVSTTRTVKIVRVDSDYFETL